MVAQRVVGFGLLALGLALLLVVATDAGGEVFLGVLGLGFLGAHGATRAYGLLVPGGILVGLAGGLFAAGQGAPDASVVLGLGVGFLAIALVDRLRGSRRPGWWWPTIPGGVLAVVGLAELTGIEGEYLFPVALIVVGGLLTLRGGRGGPRRTERGAPPPEALGPGGTPAASGSAPSAGPPRDEAGTPR